MFLLQVHIGWVSRKIASLQLLCRLKIHKTLRNAGQVEFLPLPCRLKNLLSSLFTQSIKVIQISSIRRLQANIVHARGNTARLVYPIIFLCLRLIQMDVGCIAALLNCNCAVPPLYILFIAVSEFRILHYSAGVFIKYPILFFSAIFQRRRISKDLWVDHLWRACAFIVQWSDTGMKRPGPTTQYILNTLAVSCQFWKDERQAN